MKTREELLAEQTSKMGGGEPMLIGGGGYIKDGKETFISATGELVFIPLESTYRQLSKALLSKENAAPDELLQAVSQVKDRLAQVERERDAAVHDLPIGIDCNTCKYSERAYEEQPCSGCKEYRGPWYPLHWEWRGVCDENTKEESPCSNS